MDRRHSFSRKAGRGRRRHRYGGREKAKASPESPSSSPSAAGRRALDGIAMEENSNYQLSWISGQGNPNHKVFHKKDNSQKVSVNLEEMRYSLSDKFKKQSALIDSKNDELVDLFNKIAEKRCELIQYMSSKKDQKSYRKSFFAENSSYTKKLVLKAVKVRGEVLALGGHAPLVPPHFSREVSD